MHARARLFGLVAALLCCRAARAAEAPATQFLLFDETVRYRDNWRPLDPAWNEKPFDGFYMPWMGEHFRERRSKQIPPSWLAPVNFAEGTLHVRIGVIDKPDAITTSGIILRMTTEEHAGNHTFWLCTRTCKFTKPGVYHYEEDVADGTRPYGPAFRFDLPIWELQVVVTDDKDGIVHKKWEGGYAGKPNLGLYLPLDVRVSAYVVAKGARFEPPPWWNDATEAPKSPPSWEVSSPDGAVGAVLSLSSEGRLSYTVTTGKGSLRRPVLGPSPLGITSNGVDFASGVNVRGVRRAAVRESYTLVHGKRSQITTAANELVVTVDKQGHAIDVVFRASDDGVAFRYRFAEPGAHPIAAEATGFRVPPTAKAWLLPHDEPGRWAPAYEGYWRGPLSAGSTSPSRAGWSFPALFAVNGDPKGRDLTWLLLTESDVARGWAGTRLAAEAPGGLYAIRYPDAGEGAGDGDVWPTPVGATQSPWRVIVAVPSIDRLVRTTLVTNLATRSKLGTASWVRPGRASWSWWSAESTGGLERLRAFVDLAHDMGWEYSLVDAGWDALPEAELATLARYAHERNVRLLLWYNSGGPNNPVEGTPRDRMTDRRVRRAELARVRALGVAGIKVDFFHSDKPKAISQMLDILEDAAAEKLVVTFHGCTIPRGWERTYPNLVTMEAVRGEEDYKADADYPSRGVPHQLILPFTRNVVGPMDFTPAGLSFVGHQRLTTDAYELAEAVVYESGIVHLADKAEAYTTLPREARELLRKLPAAWDDLRLLSGHPGEHVVLARRAGRRVFVAGMSAAEKPQSFELEVPFVDGRSRRATLLSDGTDGKLQARLLELGRDKLRVQVLPRGGFVLVVE